MKTTILTVVTLIVVGSMSASVAQSKYSGIYKGKAAGVTFLAAITNGGRVLGLNNRCEGLKDALDPARSTITAGGKLKGFTPGGSSLNASVSSQFVMKGTIKIDGKTYAISGNRIYK